MSNQLALALYQPTVFNVDPVNQPKKNPENLTLIFLEDGGCLGLPDAAIYVDDSLICEFSYAPETEFEPSGMFMTGVTKQDITSFAEVERLRLGASKFTSLSLEPEEAISYVDYTGGEVDRIDLMDIWQFYCDNQDELDDGPQGATWDQIVNGASTGEADWNPIVESIPGDQLDTVQVVTVPQLKVIAGGLSKSISGEYQGTTSGESGFPVSPSSSIPKKTQMKPEPLSFMQLVTMLMRSFF